MNGKFGDKELSWERFWCPREGTMRLDSSGFLLPPSEELYQYVTSDVVPAAEFHPLPCVILLGEPGMGKSHEIQRLAHRKSEGAFFRDLRKYDSTNEFSRDLRQSEEFRSWLTGDHILTLFLDSLDEALLEIRVLVDWLSDELRRLPTDRLRLRVACRTAHLSPEFEWSLREIWGEGSSGAYEITPLSRADVRLAAEAGHVEADAFLAEVVERDAVALATRPTTLAFLLKSFARDGAFPPTQIGLFKSGCQQLCTEDSSRRLKDHAGRLNPRERLAAASRVAAATVLGNRSAVWRGSNPALKPPAEVSVAELVGGTEPVERGPDLNITEDVVEEALGTGLFSARGSVSLGWAHQSYGEFLAAWWVVQHGLPVSQVDGLIRYQSSRDRRFIPQLRDTVAWLSTMCPDVRSLVLDVEPEILLETDPTTATCEDRTSLTDALLDVARRGQLAFPEFGHRRRYDRLAYPGLADQLQPVVVDSSEKRAARELALEIGSAAGAQALEDDCVRIALDECEEIGLRVGAARLVEKIGSPSARTQLTPLATEPQAADISDDLKGIALRAIWPDHLGPRELFAVLGPEKRPNRIGAYAGFLDEVAETLPSDALVAGLPWVSGIHSRLSARGRLADSIVQRAWEHLDRPELLAAYADLAADRFSRYEPLVDHGKDEFATAVAESPESRHMLLEALVERMGTAVEQVALPFTHRVHTLVTAEDFEWLLEKTVACDADDERGEAWSRLLRAAVNLTERGTFERLYAFRDSPHIDAVFGECWKPVPLESVAAEELREHHRRMAEHLQRREESKASAPDLPSAARVMALLRSAGGPREGTGDAATEAWVRAAEELTRTKDGNHFAHNMYLDRGPSWELLGESEREDVLDHAAWYVSYCATLVETWITGATATWGSWAGDRAFRLLGSQRPRALEDLGGDVWEAWVPVLLANRPLSSDDAPNQIHHELLRDAHSAAPSTTTSAARRVLLRENEEHGSFLSLSSLEPLWGKHFGAAMLDLAKDSGLAPVAFRSLLEELIRRDVKGATQFAESLLTPPLPRGGLGRSRAVEAAAALLVAGSGDVWDAIAPVLRRASKFRVEVAVSAAAGMTGLDRFTERQLAEMFLYLAKEFPYPDPWRVGVYSPSGADEARSWRSHVIAELRDRATPEAVAALERLRNELPELEWLDQTIVKCREAVRRETWTPPATQDLLDLAQEADRRIVESGEQLLSAIIESLERLEDDLHGEWPAVSGLWDRLEDETYRPKDEQELSDAVARHLRQDLAERGIAAGREVVIRRGGAGGVPGHRTDLYVTAVPERRNGDRSPIAAIIEVKGCWHHEVQTAMETQLVGDYLDRNPQARSGLYLVGWYLCDRWKEGPRKQRTQRIGSKEDLASALEKQAQSLTTDDLTVHAYVLDASWP